MNVDLDAMTEEMDPPSFKAARKKDRELLDKIKDDDLNKEFAEIHEVIEKELEERRTKVRGAYSKFTKEKSPDVTGSSGSGSDTDSEKEMEEANKFIQEETMNLIGECINTKLPSQAKLDSLLMPPPSTPARSEMETGFSI